jgi:hypothetical protein
MRTIKKRSGTRRREKAEKPDGTLDDTLDDEVNCIAKKTLQMSEKRMPPRRDALSLQYRNHAAIRKQLSI